jgi:hypothetical protein
MKHGDEEKKCDVAYKSEHSEFFLFVDTGLRMWLPVIGKRGGGLLSARFRARQGHLVNLAHCLYGNGRQPYWP